MLYSVSNWIYGDELIEKSMERISSFGYDGIEVKGEPSLYDAEEIKGLLRSYGLKASSIAGIYPWPTDERDLANPNSKVRERAVKYVKECITFARVIEAPLVIVVPSSVTKVRPFAPIETEWEWAVGSVKEVGCYAEDVGVKIAIEPINRYETYLVNNVDQALKFVKEVNMDNVKIMLDCFHMNIEEPDPAYPIRKAGKNLIHIHVADSNRRSVGRGHTDFKSIMRALKEIGYEGYLAMEPLPPTSDPYMAVKDPKTREILVRYTEECIAQLKNIEKVVEVH